MLLIVAGLASGSFLLSQSVYATDSYLGMLMKYPWYELMLSENGNRNFFASLFSALPGKEPIDEKGEKAQTIPVLVYHGITSEPDGSNVTGGRFRSHMAVLKKAGWETVSLEEFRAFMKGEQDLPEKSFLLTFDDGRKDSFYPVDPILRALDYEAVMFVITSQSLGENGKASHFYLTEKELQFMQGTGRWNLESHGKLAHELYPVGPNGQEGHFYSNLLWFEDKQRQETIEEFRKRIYADLESSKKELEESLGTSAVTVAFPFGDFGQNLFFDPSLKSIRDILLQGAKEQYSYGFYQWWEGEGFTQNHPSPETFLIKRIEPEADWSGEELLAVLENGRAKTLPYYDALSENRGWLSTWGSFELGGVEGLVLRANEDEAGASALLDGSGAWTDYEIQAVVESESQTGVFIWVRFQDVDNNAACNFGKDFVHIEQTVDGEKRVIQGIRGISPIFKGAFQVGARVQGRNVECLVNNEIVVRTQFLDPVLGRGGVGFKMWDEEVGRATLAIKQVVVYKP
ncbi:MAG: polysaccharide deacetylase family protein [Candidatus Wildermuthbacteria bacterium]|nr:polysaccharide deacetylase family protein [Candidatus Wildermuthbacteria bacterium]